MRWESEDGLWSAPLGLDRAGNLTDMTRRYAEACRGQGFKRQAADLAASVRTPDDLQAVRALYYRSRRVAGEWERVKDVEFDFGFMRAVKFYFIFEDIGLIGDIQYWFQFRISGNF